VGEGWLSAAEVARAAQMRYTKRRTEYLVARWTAKEAVARVFGLDGWTAGQYAAWARIEVRHHVTGAPELYLDGRPVDLGISLTDRAGWAVCLLGLQAGAVGCDLELVEPRSPAFVHDYLTPDEQDFVARAMDEDARQVAANLLWSAKESVLKVLRTGLRRDTRSVQVTLGPVADRTGWAPLSARTTEGTTFPGWWRRFGQFVLTVATSEATPPPAGLEDPPVLATATPAHTWLAQPVRRVAAG